MEEHTRNEPAEEPRVPAEQEDAVRADDLRQPDPPPATRLNRLAVVVAAGIMSATLLVVAFAVGGERDEEAQVREEQAEAQGVRRGASGRTFYDRPLGDDTLARVDPITGLTDDELAASAYRASVEEEAYDAGTVVGNARDGFSQPSGMVPPAYGAAGGGTASPYGSSGAYYSTGSSQPQQPSDEEQALGRAKRSALMPQGLSASASPSARGDFAGSGGRSPEESAGASDPLGESYAETLSALESMMGSRTRQAPSGRAAAMGGGQAMTPAGGPAGGQGTPTLHPSVRAEQFVRGAVAAREAESRYIATTVERPVSPYAIREGTLVEAYLVTGVHSDLPGEVVAQVSRNVYDSETQQVVLVPRGTRLIGTYDNQIAVDQSRLLVAWTRMVFPDGRSVTLPGLGSKDGAGASGLTGRVNRHYWQAFGNAMMLAVVGGSLSYAASRNRPAGGTFGYPSPGEIMAGSVATELSRVATEMLRGNVNRRPTIRIAAGTRFNVFMNGDLALAPYAAEDGFMDDGRRATSQPATLPLARRY